MVICLERDADLHMAQLMPALPLTVSLFLLLYNEHNNYSSLSNRKGANLCPKCTKIRLASLGSARGAYGLPQPLAAIGAYF